MYVKTEISPVKHIPVRTVHQENMKKEEEEETEHFREFFQRICIIWCLLLKQKTRNILKIYITSTLIFLFD